jgi:hypothetical protein
MGLQSHLPGGLTDLESPTMKCFILCAALAASPAFADDLVARQGSDSVRLAEAPCTSSEILGQLPPQVHPEFKAASAQVEGKTFAACWRKAGASAHLVYEDGDQGLIPLADLKPELSA